MSERGLPISVALSGDSIVEVRGYRR